MALMVNYCETHRYCWPISEGPEPQCPGPGRNCRVRSADAIRLVRELGQELTEAHEVEDELTADLEAAHQADTG